MTERLSDERLRELAALMTRLSNFCLEPGLKKDTMQTAGAITELLELRAENAHLRQRCTWLQERRAVLRKLVSSRWSKRREVRRLRAKLAEHEQSFKLRWDAGQRAIKRWRTANPGNDMVRPDHADLCVWLMDQLAAGPVMPEEPSEGALSTAAVVFLPRFGPRGVYWAIRDALLAEQRGVE